VQDSLADNIFNYMLIRQCEDMELDKVKCRRDGVEPKFLTEMNTPVFC